ncbi:hypothetical protein ACFWPQ_22510 [Streptomyces sp. NPDC058464]|uniref:hypothetical protein n=1 Tax=Streptomyces sp. NPDC058464 TaxID=3346511 RepID=UPI00365A3129
MTADVRPFTEAAEGTGPSVLDYRGPQGWATVVHRAHAGRFTLVGASGTPLVRNSEPEHSRTEEPRTWEYKVGLAGPQRLRIDGTGRWSISVTPLEQDEAEDGGVFCRRGIGNQTVEIVKPDPQGPAILEFTKLVCVRPARPYLRLRTDFDDQIPWSVGGVDRARFLFDHDTPPIWSAAGRVEVSNADDCEWLLRVLPLSAACPVETTTTRGIGAEALVYTGVPAALWVWCLTDVGSGSELDVRVESRDYEATLSADFDHPEGGAIVGLGPGPTLLQTEGDGGWDLRVTPLDVLPTFDQAICGSGGEVLRYTGPPAVARIVTRSWHKWSGMVSVRTLTPELRWQDCVYTNGGLAGRLRRKRLKLLPGMLVVINGPRDGSAWRIRIGTGRGLGTRRGDHRIGP